MHYLLPIQLNQIFTAETLMTPRSEWMHYNLATVEHQARDAHHSFDVVPVEDAGRVVGVILQSSREYRPLNEEWLISQDTSIPHLLDLFVRMGQQAYLVVHQQQIVGIVTPADLNKLPARVYVYHVIGGLEMALAERIREMYRNNPDEVLQLLGNRAPHVRDSQGETTTGNVEVDDVYYLDLSDLVTVLQKSDALRVKLGYTSRKAAEKALGGIVDLRHRVMHTVRPLILKQRGDEGLEQLQERLQIATAAIAALAESPAPTDAVLSIDPSVAQTA